MKKLLQRLNRWFELNLGWFLVNGRHADAYRDYLKSKYCKKDNQISNEHEYYHEYYEMMKERENADKRKSE